ncbi:hypothetical protein [Paenibacillus sacheonensis]|uniref:Uncharacterized protein n=1 Tax=Paenibacillus sacheonensis TaxID=742054 RepID=A0A7X4YTW3_9BACL|nr:hypothetical protein [Paenibacillus sacheonensis]MBM7566832.1 hypothetical protein [Paenibacillus sacheonensis]NBC71454.1 hypothetical protein [Paenibacillus sacheonensis]
MSRHTWKAAAEEAAAGGRDVISLTFCLPGFAAGEGSPPLPPGNELAEALLNAIYPLDDRWTAAMKKATSHVLRDCAFRVSSRSDDAIRFVSSGTADLFGVTPATSAALRLASLMQDANESERLQSHLRKLYPPAILAFGKLLAALLELRSSVVFELATAAGERRAAELSFTQMQAACSYIDDTDVTSLVLRVRGSLIALHPGAKTFHIDGDDGAGYDGKMTKEVRRQLLKSAVPLSLPLIVEAVIERLTTYQPSIDEESTLDLLIELDTDPGLSLDETLPVFRRLYARMNAVLERDDGDEHSSPITIEDYSALAELSERLQGSNPLKGARRALHPADLAEMHALLAESKPIGRLALTGEGGMNDEDEDAEHDAPSPAARAAKLKAVAERRRLAAAAYADIVKLTGRLLRMIDALQDIEAAASGK